MSAAVETPAERPPNKLRAVLLRVGLFTVVGAALGACWWSISRLTPLQAQSRELSRNVGRLSTEIDQMQATATEVEQTLWTNRLISAQQKLFENEEAATEWVQTLQERLVPFALEADARFGNRMKRQAVDQELAVVPLTLEIRPAAGVPGAASAYQRVMDFCQILAGMRERTDMVELSVQTGTNTVSQATVVLLLWMKAGGS